MTYRLRNLGLAIALAAVAVLLVFYYVSQERGRLQEDQELVPVWVAAKDIPVGTSGAELDAGGFLTSSEVERSQVAPGALLDPADVATKVVAAQIYKGEQVSQLRFKSEAERGIRAQLTGNLRAVQIPGNEHQLLAGTLQVGDRVDVVGTWNVPENETEPRQPDDPARHPRARGRPCKAGRPDEDHRGRRQGPLREACPDRRAGAEALLDDASNGAVDAHAPAAEGRVRQSGGRRVLVDAPRGRPQGPSSSRDSGTRRRTRT